MSIKFIVECPDCKVRFFATKELLATAYGVLRCGFCSHVFNGKEHIVYQTLEATPKQVQPVKPVSKPASTDELHKNPSIDSTAYWNGVVDTLASFSVSFKSNNNDNGLLQNNGHSPLLKKQSALEAAEEDSCPVVSDVDIGHVDADIVERIEHIDFDQLLTLDEEALLRQNLAVDSPAVVHENEGGIIEGFSPTESEINYVPNTDMGPKDIYGNVLKKVSYADFVVETPLPKKNKSTFIWGVLSLLAMLLLVGQYVRFIAPNMALKEDSREWAEKACGFLWCDIPALVDVSKIKTNQLVVSESQQFENVLNVNAIIENKLTISQPYPTIELRFTDLNGQAVASRRFLPDEYLSDEIVKKNQMQPSTPTYVSFEVIDPGEAAVGYTLYYYPAP